MAYQGANQEGYPGAQYAAYEQPQPYASPQHYGGQNGSPYQQQQQQSPQEYYYAQQQQQQQYDAYPGAAYATPPQQRYGQPDPYGSPYGGAPGGPVTAVLVSNGPPGAPPGGYWAEESYCGPASCCIGVCLLPCICFCPVDRRQVYIAPNGVKYSADGSVMSR